MPWYDDPLQFDLPDTADGWESLLLHLLGSRLSPRERQVAARRCLGYADAQIARELGITAAAVRTHDAHLLAKFGLASVRGIPFYCFSRLWARAVTTTRASQRNADRRNVEPSVFR